MKGIFVVQKLTDFEIDGIKNQNATFLRERRELYARIAGLEARAPEVREVVREVVRTEIKRVEVPVEKEVIKTVRVEVPVERIVEKVKRVEVVREDTSKIEKLMSEINKLKIELEREKNKPSKVVVKKEIETVVERVEVVKKEASGEVVSALNDKIRTLQAVIDTMSEKLNRGE
jgi:hypothetical protein